MSGVARPLDPVVAFLELEAAVAWPRDQAKRGQFLCAAGAYFSDAALERTRAAPSAEERRRHAQRAAAWEELHQRHGGRGVLNEAPPFAVLVLDFKRGSHDAWLAGRVLGFALRLAHDPRFGPAASINKAKAIVRQLPEHVASELPLPRSHGALSAAWGSHRCVAPYANAILAQRARDARRGPDGRRQDPVPARVTADEFVVVLRLAERLKIMAAAVVPHSRAEPLLSPRDMLEAPFRFAPLPEEEIELLPIPDEYLGPGQKSCG